MSGGVRSCAFNQCSDGRYAKGLCRSHYERALRSSNPEFAERQRENTRAWAATHPERKRMSDAVWRQAQTKAQKRERRLMHLYGLTIAQVDAILEAQGGACLLCGRQNRKWHIDHDHTTGTVRAILCTKCNNGLGFFDDNPAALRRAAAYLELFAP